MRTRQRMFVILLALLLGGTIAPAAAAKESVPAPDATRVVVRGKTKLADALAVASRPAWADGAARPVLVVVDVTPYTQKAETRIAEALASLGPEARSVPEWSLAALGGKPTKAVADPAALGALLPRILAKKTDAVSTVTALAKTLKSWRTKGGVVVYLADWRFEDDVDLEKFIGALVKKGRTLSVVGTEAAFRRGWNDGMRDVGERFVEDVRGIDIEDYWEGVGRDPFAGRNKKEPWHGGDTAYPYAPYRWVPTRWQTAFSQVDWDLAELEDEDPLGEIDKFLGSSEECRKLFDRWIAALDEMDEIDRKLASGDDTIDRDALEARLVELQAEADRLDEEICELRGVPCRGKIERELRAVKDDLGEILMKIIESEDAAESARLAARETELKAEVARLEAELAKLDADLAPGSTPDDATPSEEPLAPEDLKDRLPAPPSEAEIPDIVDPELMSREFPLPSSYGPYGLMRAAGVTGGRYVLWSWNPSGRRNVVYEYTRCNLFPPDLRSRKEIFSDLRRNGWARAILTTWCALLTEGTDVLYHWPAVEKNLRSPRAMDRYWNPDFALSLWRNPSEQVAFVRATRRHLAAIDAALGLLDAGIEAAGEPATPPQQRFHAEALLFRHALRVTRFELAEEIRASELITRAEWKQKVEHGVGPESWVRRGRDPERMRFWDDEPFDRAAGDVLVEERKALLARLRGTPLGEELALNTIDTARPLTYERADKVPGTGRSPTESEDTPQPTPRPTPKPPGSGSGGGGPATGGK